MDNDIQTVFGDLCLRLPDEVVPLGESGSHRRYFRIFIDGKSCILCISSNRKENSTFIVLSRYLRSKGIDVPEIYKVSPDNGAYLLEDLGDTDLLSELSKGGCSRRQPSVKMALSRLVYFQNLPVDEWKSLVEFPPLDAELVTYDLNYALSNLFIPMNIDFDPIALEDDFIRLQSRLMSYPKELWGLMYRDFQSRNIMMFKETPYFIDYQSARYGPGIYDVVSFAWQARAGFTPVERQEILDWYFSEKIKKSYSGQPKFLKDTVLSELPYWVMFRIMQTLGAYGLRGLKEGKEHFIKSIPPAASNLKETMALSGLEKEFPELNSLIKKMISFL